MLNHLQMPSVGRGARALRVAVEVPGIENIYLNDTNFIAIEAQKG